MAKLTSNFNIVLGYSLEKKHLAIHVHNFMACKIESNFQMWKGSKEKLRTRLKKREVEEVKNSNFWETGWNIQCWTRKENGMTGNVSNDDSSKNA